MIADAVRATGKIVHEEVPCTAFVSSDRRIDILIIDPSSPKKGLILDPTVRWEQNTKDFQNHHSSCFLSILPLPY